MAEFEKTGVIHREPRTRQEVAAVELARRQHGVVSREQLHRLGWGEEAIKRRLLQGRLFRVHRGAYALGRPDLRIEGRWMAAVLAMGSDALLSHRSAASLWDLLRADGRDTDVTVPGRRRVALSGIRLHQPLSIPADHRTTRDGIPMTTVPRTLLDLAADPGEPHLSRAFDQAERLGLLDMHELRRLIAENHGARGICSLRAVVCAATAPPDTRSELESRFIDFCRTRHLPLPDMNCVVAGHVVDARWPGKRLVVELDGFQWHRDRSAFEEDRRRDGDLLLAGYHVLRITDRRLRDEPEAIAAAVRHILER